MARGLRFGNYGVYVWRERGGRHNSPHAHILLRGQRVASLHLLTLTVFDDNERLPKPLLAEIVRAQETLVELWQELNSDD